MCMSDANTYSSMTLTAVTTVHQLKISWSLRNSIASPYLVRTNNSYPAATIKEKEKIPVSEFIPRLRVQSEKKNKFKYDMYCIKSP